MDKAFTIRVLDINEPPTDVALSNSKIPENLPPFTLVGVVTCRDPDNAVNRNRSSVIFSLNSNGPFVLVNGTILLTTRQLDFENTSSYNITLTATDDGMPPLDTIVSLTVDVIDTNDHPQSIRFASNGVPENSPIGTVAGSFSVYDEDKLQDHLCLIARVVDTMSTSVFLDCSSYSIYKCFCLDLFTIVNNQLVVAVSEGLDFEQSPSHTMIVRCTDNGKPRLYVEVR